METEKARLRAAVRARRRERAPAELEAIGVAVGAELAELVAEHGARTVAAFLATRDEPDTRPFLRWARDAGVRVFLPHARAGGRLEWALDTGAEVRNERLRLPEPDGRVLPPSAFEAVELILLPAALVARDGTRLGWGGGYYDRLLDGLAAPRPPCWAVVHDDEFVDALPREPHDAPVQGAITASGRHPLA